MAAPDQIVPEWLLHWLGPVASAAVLGLWRMVSGKASKVDLDKTIEAFEKSVASVLERIDENQDEAKQARERIYDKLDEMSKGLGAAMVGLSGLQGRLDAEAELRQRPKR